MAGADSTVWLGDVVAAERSGELLTAVDLAERGLEEHSGDVALQYRAVLALARAGSTDQAARRFEEYGLRAVDTEDVRALEARIAKDVAACGHRRGTENSRAGFGGALRRDLRRNGRLLPGNQRCDDASGRRRH